MFHPPFFVRLLIVLGSLTVAFTQGEATAQANTPGPASDQDSRIPPEVRDQIEGRVALLAGKFSYLPLATRRVIVRDYVLSAFAQAARLPGIDVNLLNPTEQQEAEQIVEKVFSSSPTPGPEPQPTPPAPAPAPIPSPSPPAPAPPPQPAPAPSPGPAQPLVWVVYYVVPQQSPVLLPAHSWVQVQPVVPTYQWVPAQGMISTGNHFGHRKPWHPWSR